MIYIFTAIYPEAKCMIDGFKMKKRSDFTRFQVFEGKIEEHSKDIDVRLVITGVGTVRMAVAVSCVCTFFGVSGEDYFVNIGTAGIVSGSNECKGEMYICNKITDKVSGMSYYPDMVYRNDILETQIITCPVIFMKDGSTVQNKDISENRIKERSGVLAAQCTSASLTSSQTHSCNPPEALSWLEPTTPTKTNNLYTHHLKKQEYCPARDNRPLLADCEAAGAYQAAIYFFEAHHMSFLKLVSDNGTADSLEVLNSEIVEIMFSKVYDRIYAYIKSLSAISLRESQKHNCLPEILAESVEKLAKAIHCSKVMEDELRQLIKYGYLSGISLEELLRITDCEGYGECRSKKEGKIIIEQIRKHIL